MTRKLIYMSMAVAALCLASCSDDKDAVRIDLASDALQFTPAHGGAVLHYKLPNDPDVVGIHVRYNDCYNAPILRTGSVQSDSMTLVGFNEAQQNIPAEVTLQLRNGSESQPIAATFSTLDSNPITFLKTVKVNNSWNGFSMNYKVPEDAKGMFYVFYLGTNPYTHQPDTIQLDQQALNPGGDTLFYQPKQLSDKGTIVVKSEDYRGHIVGTQVYEVEPIITTKRDGIKISYANSYESEDQKTGVQYLTDGDTNGWRWFESHDEHKFYTFVSKREAYGPESAPMYVDLGAVTMVASIRLYAYLFNYNQRVPGKTNWQPCWDDGSDCVMTSENFVGQMIHHMYFTHLPSNIDVYASKESGTSTDYDNMQWEKIGKFDDDPDILQTFINYGFSFSNMPEEEIWFKGCTRYPNSGREGSAEEVEALDPRYAEISFLPDNQGEGYRYLKLVFNDWYRYPYNDAAYFSNKLIHSLTFNELEVYTKK